MKGLASLCLVTALVASAASASDASAQGGVPDDRRVAALAKPNAAMAEARLATLGTVVIAEHRGYIVVSYLQMGPNVRGGAAHVVYDPKTDKVVYLLGQD